MRRQLFIAAAVLTLVAAACGNDNDTPSGASDTTTTAPEGNALRVRAIAPFGEVLTDGDGNTLYIFTKDEAGRPKSTCNGQCAQTWPPLLTSAGAGVANGLDPSKLGETTRDDGTKQYTYNTWPLYRYAADQAAGDANGQGVGGVWFVVGTDGNPVKAGAASTTTAARPTSGY